MDGFEVRPLGPETWDAFVALCDRHGGGGFGGCYCTWFHRAEKGEKGRAGIEAVLGPDAPESPLERTREYKHRLVETGHAHAALVFDGDEAVAWAQYGPPAELAGLTHRKQVEDGWVTPPDWRITCVFVDRRYRRRGVTHVAVAGALDLIAEAGGGVVESYPQDTPGRKVSASFLYNATRTVFEAAGFVYERPKGKNHCIVRRTVAPAPRALVE